jgi:acyl-coenzyme A thioesterase PaaI-like protein
MGAGANLVWDAAGVLAFLEREFPQEFHGGRYEIAALSPSRIEVVLNAGVRELRPGGTVSGPALMALMDCAAYALLIGRHGEAGRLMVTTGMAMSFLRKAGPGRLTCTIDILKGGRTLTVVDARVTAGDPHSLVAHGEFTYHTARAG